MNLREWALPVYTILMQLATGTLFILWAIRTSNLNRVGDAGMDRILRRPVLVVFLTILLAMIGSHFHLSNPLLSFMAVLNLRHSWLSREIVLTILMFFTCAALVDQIWSPEGKRPRLKTLLGWAAVVLGCGSIYCMASIYLLPTQSPWNNPTTILLFFCSAILLGVVSAVALLVMEAIFAAPFEPESAESRLEILQRSFGKLTGLLIGSLVMIIFLNGIQFRIITQGNELAQTSSSLLFELYGPLLALRFIILIAGAGVLVLAAFWLWKKDLALSELVAPVYLACLLTMIAEILGRFLFYASHVRLGI
jgi:anaerobic dimethyl sulfoxide reductase subunit C (anchor subunit)